MNKNTRIEQILKVFCDETMFVSIADAKRIKPQLSAILSRVEDDLLERVREHLLAEHVHYDREDAWQFNDGAPYVQSTALEKELPNMKAFTV